VLFAGQTAHRPADVFGVHEQADCIGFGAVG